MIVTSCVSLFVMLIIPQMRVPVGTKVVVRQQRVL